MRARLLPLLILWAASAARFDDVGRSLEEGAPIPHVVHPPARSVPSRRRMPHAMANNRTHFVRGLTSRPGTLDATQSVLNDYNPVLLPLYKNGPGGLTSNLDRKLLDDLTGRSHPGFTRAETDRVKYLAVFRSSNHYPPCMPGVGGWRTRRYEWVNYPALVLLDERLRAIADVVIDVEKYYFEGKRDTRELQDFALYAARTTATNPKKDQLFLLANGMHAIPMALRRVPPDVDGLDSHPEDLETKIKRAQVPRDMKYGYELQVRLARASDPSRLRVAEGKNMHFFEARDGRPYLEVWPLTEMVQPVDFFAEDFTSPDAYAIRLGRPVAPVAESSWSPRERSVALPGHEGVYVKRPVDRGTACCADLTLSDGRDVKVGIAHAVTSRRAYIHRFYAFLSEPPFPTVGVSPYFCLGAMRRTDADHELHWLSSARHTFKRRRTRIGQASYDCPLTTFASGIANFIGHGAYLVVSYGVDDCYSRSIVVGERTVEGLLVLNGTRGGVLR